MVVPVHLICCFPSYLQQVIQLSPAALPGVSVPAAHHVERDERTAGTESSSSSRFLQCQEGKGRHIAYICTPVEGE